MTVLGLKVSPTFQYYLLLAAETCQCFTNS